MSPNNSTSSAGVQHSPAASSSKQKRSKRSAVLWLIPLFLGVIIGGILGYFVPRILLKPNGNITSTTYAYTTEKGV